MARLHYYLAPLLLATAGTAQASDTKLLVNAEHVDFSKDFGIRTTSTLESTTDLGKTAFTIGASYGHRKFATDSYSALRVSGTIFHDWSDKVYTRTNVALSSDKPVFAKRDVSTDLNFKPVEQAVVTVGARQARYHGNRDAFTLSAGGSWYFAGGFASYRFSSAKVDILGRSHSHLATFRLKDGRKGAFTQLWLGAGTSLHEFETVPANQRGKYRSVALQRSQPLTNQLSINSTIGRAWYETPAANYRGTTVSIGLAVSDLPFLK